MSLEISGKKKGAEPFLKVPRGSVFFVRTITASCLRLCHLCRLRGGHLEFCVELGDLMCFIEDTERICVEFLCCGLLCVEKVDVHKLWVPALTHLISLCFSKDLYVKKKRAGKQRRLSIVCVCVYLSVIAIEEFDCYELYDRFFKRVDILYVL